MDDLYENLEKVKENYYKQFLEFIKIDVGLVKDINKTSLLLIGFSATLLSIGKYQIINFIIPWIVLLLNSVIGIMLIKLSSDGNKTLLNDRFLVAQKDVLNRCLPSEKISKEIVDATVEDCIKVKRFSFRENIYIGFYYCFFIFGIIYFIYQLYIMNN